MSDLARTLLAPASVALVGASDEPLKASTRPREFLRDSGYAGQVYLVNSRRETVGGQRAYPSLRDLPAVPEHAFVMTPTSATLDVIAECAELGVPVATVLSGGFAEDGPVGRERQEQLVSIARSGGVRLLGPGSLGLVNLRCGLRLTGNAIFGEPDLPAGGTVVASQSGSMIGALASRGRAARAGFHTVISVGTEADLSIGEICSLTLDDDAVTGYALFLETIRHAGELAEFARKAAEAGRPVVAYKLGRSKTAAQLAMTHTGALAGEDDVADAFLKACGIARVHTLDGLLEAQPLARQLPIRESPAAPRVGVVTTTGGGGALVIDQLGLRGVVVQTPSGETFDRLAARGVDVAHAPMVDLTLAGTRPDIMAAALETMLSAPEFDLVVAVVGSSARLRPELAVAPIIDCAGGRVPLVAFLVPDAPAAAGRLAGSGVAVFTSPDACADVIAGAFARRRPARLAGPSADPGSPCRYLDEAAAYDVLSAAGVPVAPFHVLEVQDGTVGDVELPFGYPVAVKVLDAEVPHKTDVGGVELGASGPDEVRRAVGRIAARVAQARPGTVVARVIVQPMTRGAGEVLIGLRHDQQVGPVVMLAAGGTLAELYGDRSIRPAPVGPGEAEVMLGEVTALQALRGFRGAARADLSALRDALVALSRLASDPRVAEAEVNPLVVMSDGHGVAAIDALVRTRR